MNTLQIAIAIVKQANNLLNKKFNSNGQRNFALKKNDEIVTLVDLASNKLITAQLKKYFPNDSIISEEKEEIVGASGYTWYVDPLDGTTNFAYGYPLFAVCLARVKNNETELGAIGIPTTGRVFSVSKTSAPRCNDKKIQARGKTNGLKTKKMLLICDGHTPAAKKKFFNILQKIDTSRMRIRVIASAGMEMAAVAEGQADACIMTDIHPWDVLPGVLLVRQAGGKVTNFAGEEWKISDETLIASKGEIHEEMLKLTR